MVCDLEEQKKLVLSTGNGHYNMSKAEFERRLNEAGLPESVVLDSMSVSDRIGEEVEHLKQEISALEQPSLDSIFDRYASDDMNVSQPEFKMTPAQKKMFLGAGIGAMSACALLFIVAIILKRRRKAAEKARDAIIVETGLLPLSYSSVDLEKNDPKRIGKGEIHSCKSEKEVES